jgi:hypothetical protein
MVEGNGHVINRDCFLVSTVTNKVPRHGTPESKIAGHAATSTGVGWRWLAGSCHVH